MRSSPSPLVAYHRCRCGEDHPVKFKILGTPLVECAKEKGDLIHAAQMPNGSLYYIVGKIG